MLLWSDFIDKTNFAVRPQYANFMLISGVNFDCFFTKTRGITSYKIKKNFIATFIWGPEKSQKNEMLGTDLPPLGT